MREYTPTEARICIDFCNAAMKRRQPDGTHMTMEEADAAFARWLATHDAEVRAAVVTEDPEWEYGIRPEDDDVPLGVSPMPTLEAARTRADNIYGGWVIVRRRKAGPWVPVKQEGADGG